MSWPPSIQHRVAIPRLERIRNARGDSVTKARVDRACTTCRTQKVKCSGKRPRCERCEAAGFDCTYVMQRKDKLEKARSRCRQMAEILEAMRLHANEEDSVKIARVLEAEEADQLTDPCKRSVSSPRPDIGGDLVAENRTMHRPFAPSLSRRMDSIQENLHADLRARRIGYTGVSSAMRWLEQVADMRIHRPVHELQTLGERTFQSPDAKRSSPFCYWADAEGEVALDTHVDPYELPPYEVAKELLDCYMTNIHDTFPILSRRNFERQFCKYYAALKIGTPPTLSAKWQAILNVVFAISAIMKFQTTNYLRTSGCNHLVFCSRARLLYLDRAQLASPADVPQLQGHGLLAFYCLCTGQINRAWVIEGMAIRSALSLGLHLRNADSCAIGPKRERLVRVWWSLCSIETRLNIITGRPSAVVNMHCTVPLPTPEEEEQIVSVHDECYTEVPEVHAPDPNESLGLLAANSGSYFRAVTELGNITQDILTQLHSAVAATKSQAQIRHDILQLNSRLERWCTWLPRRLRYWDSLNTSTTTFSRERLSLGLKLSETKMLLTQPCLYVLLDHQVCMTHEELSFIKQMSVICLEAARSTVDLLPDQPQLSFLYNQCPWWCLVHLLVEAAAVFLLSSLKETPALCDSGMLPLYMNKIHLWLQQMDDSMAHEARIVLGTFWETFVDQNMVDGDPSVSDQLRRGSTGSLC